eukprot:6204342-Pleurochrysis_carterae.AAC.7
MPPQPPLNATSASLAVHRQPSRAQPRIWHVATPAKTMKSWLRGAAYSCDAAWRRAQVSQREKSSGVIFGCEARVRTKSSCSISESPGGTDRLTARAASPK